MIDLDTYDWTINGMTLKHVGSMDITAFPKITLHCITDADDSSDARDEVALFQKLGCNTINNKVLGNGSTDLQTSPVGQIYPIINNGTTWNGALYYPQYSIDNIARINNKILYDLIFELQQTNNPTSDVFIPDLRLYPNVDYSCWTNNPYALITNGISQDVVPAGSKNVQTINVNSVHYNWDGTGHVYIASSWLADPTTDKISVDDKLIVSNGTNTLTNSYNASNRYKLGPDMEITSLLVEGDNFLNVKIHDIYGAKIGCGPLFIIQPKPQPNGGTVSAFPQTVTQNSPSSPIDSYVYAEWSDIDNIKSADGNVATCTNNGVNGTNCSQILNGSNFGLDIGTVDLEVTRVQIKVNYANNSDFGVPSDDTSKHTVIISGSVFGSQTITKDYVQNSTPDNIQTLILDTLDGSLPLFSNDPSAYNDPTFMVSYQSPMDQYKSVWVDSIEVIITFDPPSNSGDNNLDPDAEGNEFGYVTITLEREAKEVHITGNGCNIPATTTVNGMTNNWHYSHDHNTGDIGSDGIETLIYTLNPPSQIIVISTSTHLPPSDGTDTAANNSGTRLDPEKGIEVFY
jgi:hypothetical protein